MRIAVLLVTLLAAVGALAESSDCVNPSLVQADNRMVTSHFAGTSNGNNPTYWYAIYGQAGHSYSVEFVATTDNEYTNTSIVFSNLYVWGPNDVGSLQQNNCWGPTSVPYYATQTYSPALSKSRYGTGQRISFIAASSGLYIVSITNLQAAGTYSYRFTDTTLVSPRWSTCSGFDTSWGFTNMSDMPITGTLYVYGANNQLLLAKQISIPASQQIFKGTYINDLNLPRNNAGFVLFAHNGPAGAILADAYMQNGNDTITVPGKFESRYTQ